MQALFQFNGPVAGVDEAGRGPLAGPVVAAAVILHPQRRVSGLDDSKKLSAARREELAGEIRTHALAWSVAWADPAEIDALNILAATMLAMRRAIIGLPVTPNGVQVDGNRLPNLCINDRRLDGEAIVGGDALVPAISAASIIAKTTRDRWQLGMAYPGFQSVPPAPTSPAAPRAQRAANRNARDRRSKTWVAFRCFGQIKPVR